MGVNTTERVPVKRGLVIESVGRRIDVRFGAWCHRLSDTGNSDSAFKKVDRIINSLLPRSTRNHPDAAFQNKPGVSVMLRLNRYALHHDGIKAWRLYVGRDRPSRVKPRLKVWQLIAPNTKPNLVTRSPLDHESKTPVPKVAEMPSDRLQVIATTRSWRNLFRTLIKKPTPPSGDGDTGVMNMANQTQIIRSHLIWRSWTERDGNSGGKVSLPSDFIQVDLETELKRPVGNRPTGDRKITIRTPRSHRFGLDGHATRVPNARSNAIQQSVAGFSPNPPCSPIL